MAADCYFFKKNNSGLCGVLNLSEMPMKTNLIIDAYKTKRACEKYWEVPVQCTPRSISVCWRVKTIAVWSPAYSLYSYTDGPSPNQMNTATFTPIARKSICCHFLQNRIREPQEPGEGSTYRSNSGYKARDCLLFRKFVNFNICTSVQQIPSR